LPEVFSFSETLLQSGATGNVRKSINVISEYDKSFFRKGPEHRLFSKKRVFRVIRKEIVAFTIGASTLSPFSSRQGRGAELSRGKGKGESGPNWVFFGLARGGYSSSKL
jgi:hypothetical protein